MKNIRIEVPALSENIRMIESFIDNAKEQFHLDDDIYGNIMIAVTEAVNNAIKHGSMNDSSKNVLLSLSLDESTIKFKVEDQGPGFNFHNLPDPTSPEHICECGGRGVFLMRQLSDRCRFHDNGRTVEMEFKL